MPDLTYRSPKTEVRASPIHGRGLFAAQPIARGEIVAVKGGYVLTRSQWTALEPALGPAEIQISEDLVIAPVQDGHRDGSMLFTNHSCDPNLAIQGQIVLVAMRDIRSGDELTIDWATTDDGDYELECRCGSPRCRGRDVPPWYFRRRHHCRGIGTNPRRTSPRHRRCAATGLLDADDAGGGDLDRQRSRHSAQLPLPR